MQGKEQQQQQQSWRFLLFLVLVVKTVLVVLCSFGRVFFLAVLFSGLQLVCDRFACDRMVVGN